MRTDLQLQQQVTEELEWEPGVDTAHVAVAAKNGVVTLAGTVSTYAERIAAERATKRVMGVRGIANDLIVELGVNGKRPDADIARAAVQALDWNVAVPRDAVKVTVTNGHVKLEGKVSYYYQRAAAESAVDHLIGVTSVSNLVSLKPPVAVVDVKHRIEEAFKRSAQLDAQNVKVDVMDGAVTLTGKVRSWSERTAAEDAVWASPGVSRVNDLLTVGA